VRTFFKHEMTSAPADKRDKAKAKLKAWQTLRQLVLLRDKRRCRVCKSGTQVDVHHVRFRSVLGPDSMSNLASICRCCHAEIHLHKLTLSGDANGTLKVTRC